MKKIAIHSVPRSGSSWLGQIFNSHPNVAYRFQPLFSYAFKDRLNENSSAEEIRKFFNDLLTTDDDFVLQRNDGKIAKHVPQFFKSNVISHIVYKEVRYNHIIKNLLEKDNEIKVIGLVRNPFATINSWLRAPKEFRKDLGWNELEEWRFAPSKNQNKKEEFNGYEKWKEVAQLFLSLQNEFPDRFYLLKYNDLLIRTFETVEKIFAFSDLEVHKQTMDFLQESKSKEDNDPYGVFKKIEKDEKWKTELDKRIVDAIKEDITDSKLEIFLV